MNSAEGFSRNYTTEPAVESFRSRSVRFIYDIGFQSKAEGRDPLNNNYLFDVERLNLRCAQTHEHHFDRERIVRQSVIVTYLRKSSSPILLGFPAQEASIVIWVFSVAV